MDFIRIRKKFRCTASSITPYVYTSSGMVWTKRGEIYKYNGDPAYVNETIVTPLSLPKVLKLLQKNPKLLDNVKEML